MVLYANKNRFATTQSKQFHCIKLMSYSRKEKSLTFPFITVVYGIDPTIHCIHCIRIWIGLYLLSAEIPKLCRYLYIVSHSDFALPKDIVRCITFFIIDTTKWD